MKKVAFRLSLLLLCISSMIGMSSCVHEFPDSPEHREVTLLIKHELPWTLFYFNLPLRSVGDTEGCHVAYTMEVYPHGTTDVCVRRARFIKDDVSLSDFYQTLSVPPGHYDIWIWSDFVDPSTGASLFYDAKNFHAISLTEPYRGDTSRKDAFQGVVEVNVPGGYEETGKISAEVTLRRPLTGYAFIANDVREFIEQETRRLSSERSTQAAAPNINFNNYTVRITYPGYIPCTYSIFRNKPIDSLAGVSFTGSISILESDNALLAFDMALINGEESTLSITLEVFDDRGELVSSVPGVIIPTKRNRATIIEAPFLTTKAQSGVTIDTSFTNDFNIKI